jgi:non-homologous end joining protein Ku
MIEQKAAGKTVEAPKAVSKKETKPGDLLAALEASLAAAKSRATGGAKAEDGATKPAAKPRARRAPTKKT